MLVRNVVIRRRKLPTREDGRKRQRSASLSPRLDGGEQNAPWLDFNAYLSAAPSCATATARGTANADSIATTFSAASHLPVASANKMPNKNDVCKYQRSGLNEELLECKVGYNDLMEKLLLRLKEDIRLMLQPQQPVLAFAPTTAIMGAATTTAPNAAAVISAPTATATDVATATTRNR